MRTISQVHFSSETRDDSFPFRTLEGSEGSRGSFEFLPCRKWLTLLNVDLGKMSLGGWVEERAGRRRQDRGFHCLIDPFEKGVVTATSHRIVLITMGDFSLCATALAFFSG